MPYIEDGLPLSALGSLSPLRSKLEDMILSCTYLNKRIALMNDDKETYGMLTEETYCYDVPVRRVYPERKFMLIFTYRKYSSGCRRSRVLQPCVRVTST